MEVRKEESQKIGKCILAHILAWYVWKQSRRWFDTLNHWIKQVLSRKHISMYLKNTSLKTVVNCTLKIVHWILFVVLFCCNCLCLSWFIQIRNCIRRRSINKTGKLMRIESTREYGVRYWSWKWWIFLSLSSWSIGHIKTAAIWKCFLSSTDSFRCYQNKAMLA